MRRLAATLRLDLRLQVRNHLYLFTALTTLLLLTVLRQLVPREVLEEVFPPLLFLWLGSTTLMFVAAQVLFEKGEGTLSAVTVSPLRTLEYLVSKLLTLTSLATVESLALLFFSYGTNVNLPLLLLGVVGLAALYTLVGLILVVRYDSVTHFLMTSPLYLTPLCVPALGLTGLWDSPFLYLWPTQGPLLLLEGAFQDVAAWQVGYALVWTALSLVGLVVWAERAFYRHVILKAGA